MPSWTNDRRRTSGLTANFIFTCARSGDWTQQNETANQTSRDLTEIRQSCTADEAFALDEVQPAIIVVLCNFQLEGKIVASEGYVS